MKTSTIKSLIAITIAMTGVQSLLVAQNNWLTGNNATGGGLNTFTAPGQPQFNTFGTAASAPAAKQPINFFTAGTQKATLLANGNFGLGTPSPAYRLDVAGSLHSSGNAYLGGFLGVGNTNTGSDVFRTTSNAPINGYNAWRMYTGAGTGTEKFSIYTAPTVSDPNSKDVIIQASQSGAKMLFNIVGPAPRSA